MLRLLGPALTGAVLGALLGWFYPDLHGVPQASPDVRWPFVWKIGAVFGFLGYFLAWYGETRRRLVERVRRRQR